MTEKIIKGRARRLRKALDAVFADDTAYPGTVRHTPSAGHCAVAAILVQDECGGELVSADVAGVSHWFTRITTRHGQRFDVCLTGDQFGGRPAIQVGPRESLYGAGRVRSREHDVSAETDERYHILRNRVIQFLKYGELP